MSIVQLCMAILCVKQVLFNAFKSRKLRLCIRKCSMHVLWMGLSWGHVIVGRLLCCERCCGSHVPTDRVLMVGSTYCKQQYQHIHHWKHSATGQFFTSISFDTSWPAVPVTKDLTNSDCFYPISAHWKEEKSKPVKEKFRTRVIHLKSLDHRRLVRALVH